MDDVLYTDDLPLTVSRMKKSVKVPPTSTPITVDISGSTLVRKIY